MVTIRVAGPDDLRSLAGLMGQFYEEAGFSISQEAAESAFSALIADPAKGRVILALQDGVPAGHAVVTWRYAMEYAGMIAYIDDLFVHPGFRRNKIGAGLIRFITGLGSELNHRALLVEVGQDNHPALALYRAAGLNPFSDGRTCLIKTYRPAGEL